MAGNIFEEKVDFLIRVREEVEARDNLEKQLDEMKSLKKKLSRNISLEEKSIQDEISQTVRKRMQELEAGYDRQLDENRSKRKNVINRKEKTKSKRMNKRVEEETKEIRQTNKDLELELKTLFKKNKVPRFCKRKIFYYLFMPSGFAEILKMLIGFIIIFAGLPAAVTLLVREYVLKGTEADMTLWTVLIPAVWIIVALIIYFIMYNKIKVRHIDTITEGRKIRDSIKTNEKKAAAIKNSINKDKDESIYNLDSYDKKIQNIEKEADEITKEKKKALKTFEDETKQMIIDEINGRRLEALENMKKEKKDLDDKVLETEERYSDFCLAITNNYAAYIGEEFCRMDKLDDLIAIMQEGSADTVSEAIAAYKGQKSPK